MAKKTKCGGSKKGRQSVNHKVKYERQRIRTERTKRERREKHLKNHPNEVDSIKNWK